MRARTVLAALFLLVGPPACDDDTAPTGADGVADAAPDVDRQEVAPDVVSDVADTGPADGDAGVDDTDADGPAPDADADDATPSLDDNFGVEEEHGDPACEGILETHCVFPFPSNRFLDDGEDGRRLRFPAGTLPTNADGVPMRDDHFADVDGFGLATPILLAWPGATLDGAPPVFEPAASLEPDSRTIVLDAETGERVAHWTEADWLTAGADAPVFALRPADPLQHDTRYIVALRGLVDAEGEALEAPRGFRALRDQEASVVRGVHARRAHFEEHVFPALEGHGVDRAALQLAWDFTTASRDNSTFMLATMRERLLEAIGDEGPEYTIDSVDALGDPHIAWMARGRLFVPSFMEAPDPETGLRTIRRDADGLPAWDGHEEVAFELQVPASAQEVDEPLGVLMYGHGFTGTKGQATRSWIRSLAAEYGFLILGLDMQGMTDGSMDTWFAEFASDASAMPLLAEEPMQGIINHVAALRMMKGGFLDEDHEELTTEDGAPLYDPERLWYYGNSQGGTLGTLIMATTPDVAHGVLGVPGSSFPLLLHRSSVFVPFSAALDFLYDDPWEVSIIMGMFGTAFDRIDGMVWGPHIERTPLPGDEPRSALLHVAKEDAQVHTETSFLLGRAVGAPLMVPAIRSVWGLPEEPYPYEGSAVVEFDFGIPDDADPTTPPPAETDTHGWLRKLPEGRAQMMHFLETGEVIDVCGGEPCVIDGEPANP